MKEVKRHDGTRADHRVVQSSIVFEHIRVETLFTWLTTDGAMHRLRAHALQCDAVVERLAGRLNGKVGLEVTDSELLPIDRHDRYAQVFRIYLRQRSRTRRLKTPSRLFPKMKNW